MLIKDFISEFMSAIGMPIIVRCTRMFCLLVLYYSFNQLSSLENVKRAVEDLFGKSFVKKQHI